MCAKCVRFWGGGPTAAGRPSAGGVGAGGAAGQRPRNGPCRTRSVPARLNGPSKACWGLVWRRRLDGPLGRGWPWPLGGRGTVDCLVCRPTSGDIQVQAVDQVHAFSAVDQVQAVDQVRAVDQVQWHEQMSEMIRKTVRMFLFLLIQTLPTFGAERIYHCCGFQIPGFPDFQKSGKLGLGWAWNGWDPFQMKFICFGT